jgi:hypothetical protein
MPLRAKDAKDIDFAFRTLTGSRHSIPASPEHDDAMRLSRGTCASLARFVGERRFG